MNKINYKALLINKQKTIYFHNFDLLHCKNSQRISNRNFYFSIRLQSFLLFRKQDQNVLFLAIAPKKRIILILTKLGEAVIKDLLRQTVSLYEKIRLSKRYK